MLISDLSILHMRYEKLNNLDPVTVTNAGQRHYVTAYKEQPE
jgi:hypothetical protein